jgi:hypothetical protein
MARTLKANQSKTSPLPGVTLAQQTAEQQAYADRVAKAAGVSSDYVPTTEFWQSSAGLGFVKE